MYEDKKSILQKIGLGLPVDDKGVGPNVARSSEDWRDFKIFHKKNNPIRYFLNEDFNSIFIWPWSMPLRRAKEWIEYRTTRRYHVVKTGQKPGYSDLSEKMLHVNFNMLKEFVEVEKAHMWQWSESEFKSEQPGVSHLLWEMGLDDDNEHQNQQSVNAREQYELYDWWTNVRPYRESIDVGWEAYHELRNEIYGDECFFCSDKDTPELKELQKKWIATSSIMEKNYAEEDEAMLIRLMKIRGSLWT